MNTNYLFDQTFKKVQKMAKDYYFKILQKNIFLLPTLNNDPVSISREGWSHLHQKTRSRMEMLSRYFALLKIPAILSSKDCRYIHEKGRDGNSEFWVLHGTIDDVMTKVIIRSVNGGHKHFYSVIWKGEEKRAVSRLYPRCRGMITSQLFRKSILSRIGKLSIIKSRMKHI